MQLWPESSVVVLFPSEHEKDGRKPDDFSKMITLLGKEGDKWVFEVVDFLVRHLFNMELTEL